MIPKYSINLLSSVATWLSGRSTTVWAKAFGHTHNMQAYAKSLHDIIDYLKSQYEQCSRCGGTDGPLLRDVEPSFDCHCVERLVTVDFSTGPNQELTLSHPKTRIRFTALEPDLVIMLTIRTGPNFQRILLETLNSRSFSLPLNSINLIQLKSLPNGVVTIGAVYDFK